MKMVNIADAKATLSELVDAAARGEKVVICKRNQPVAELRAVEGARQTPRDLSPMFPGWTIDPAFYEPLPDDFLEAFYDGPVLPADPRGDRPARVAERPADDAAQRRSKPRHRRS